MARYWADQRYITKNQVEFMASVPVLMASFWDFIVQFFQQGLFLSVTQNSFA